MTRSNSAHINEGYKTDENSRQASRSQRSSTSINHDDDFAFKPLPSSDTDFAFDRTTQGGGRHDPEASIGSLEHGFPSAIHTRRSYNNIGPDESPESPLRDPTNLSSREPSLPRKSRPTSLQNARRAHDKAEDGNNGRTVETSSHYVPPNSLPEAVPFISAPRGNTAANTEEEPVKLEAPAGEYYSAGLMLSFLTYNPQFLWSILVFRLRLVKRTIPGDIQLTTVERRWV